jgi:hypothetical protein
LELKSLDKGKAKHANDHCLAASNLGRATTIDARILLSTSFVVLSSNRVISIPLAIAAVFSGAATDGQIDDQTREFIKRGSFVARCYRNTVNRFFPTFQNASPIRRGGFKSR